MQKSENKVNIYWRLLVGALIGVTVLATLLAMPSRISAKKRNPVKTIYDAMTAIELAKPSKLKKTDTAYFDILLKPKQQSALLKQAIAVNTPGSDQFKHFITPAEFRQTYGQSKTVTNQWTVYLKKHGLKTAVYKNGLILNIHGKVGKIDQLFRTDMNKAKYHADPLQFGAKKPNIPKRLARTVWTVLGITDHNPANIGSSTPSYTHATTSKNYFKPGYTKRFTNRYHVDALYRAGLTGKGQTIGIIAFGNFRYANAIHFWKTQQANANVTRLSTKKVTGPVYQKGIPVAKDESETTMDVEYAGSVAPQSNIRVYLGTSSASTLANFVNVYAKAFDENEVSTISSSWSLGPYMALLKSRKVLSPVYGQVLNVILAQGALQGISNFTSSGDSGALNPTIVGTNKYGGLQDYRLTAEDPFVTNPYLTSVGGTTLPFKANLGEQLGIKIGTTTVKSERAWGDDYLWPALSKQPTLVAKAPQLIAITSGGGGGFSSLYPTPNYQQGVSGINTFNARDYFSSFHQPIFNSPLISGTNTGRNFPDVSGNADPMTGYYVYQKQKHGSSWGRNGGTSITSPQYAAVAAVINSQPGRARMGFWNPQIYQLAQRQDSPFTPLNNTQNNSNLYYTGQPGKVYNQATGLGITNFDKLASVYK